MGQFNTDLHLLAAGGLSAALIAQLQSAGATTGDEAARQLLAQGQAGIAQANQQYALQAQSAAEIGQLVAGQQYANQMAVAQAAYTQAQNTVNAQINTNNNITIKLDQATLYHGTIKTAHRTILRNGHNKLGHK